MLSAISSIFQAISSLGHTENSKFIVSVQEVEGKQALLKINGRLFSARINVPVEKGENLLLEKSECKDGVIYCRLLQRDKNELRRPETEGAVLSALIYMEDNTDDSYLLSVKRKDPKSSNVVHDNCWNFIIQTVNLGVVALQIIQDGGVYHASILTETASALTIFKNSSFELDDLQIKHRSVICWRQPRLMTAAEREFMSGTGSNIDILG